MCWGFVQVCWLPWLRGGLPSSQLGASSLLAPTGVMLWSTRPPTTLLSLPCTRCATHVACFTSARELSLYSSDVAGPCCSISCLAQLCNSPCADVQAIFCLLLELSQMPLRHCRSAGMPADKYKDKHSLSANSALH